MYTKIVTAVALRPIARWASNEAKREVLPLFAGQDLMICGLASTEPGCGSAMSAMATTFEEVDGGYRIRGRKHWQGFSATAHRWLVAAKNDEHGRRYGYFILRVRPARHRRPRRRRRCRCAAGHRRGLAVHPDPRPAVTNTGGGAAAHRGVTGR